MARSSRVHVELEGIADLKLALARLDIGVLREAKAVVQESAEDMLGEAQGRAPVSEPGTKSAGREPSGTTRAALKIIYRDLGMSATIGTKYYVARFNEFGTVNMPAQPFMTPAFEIVRPKYLSNLARAVNRATKAAGE